MSTLKANHNSSSSGVNSAFGDYKAWCQKRDQNATGNGEKEIGSTTSLYVHLYTPNGESSQLIQAT